MLSIAVHERCVSTESGAAYGYGADEEAPRGEVEVLWGCVLLGVSAAAHIVERHCHVPASAP
jgi:hypothetical protein